MSGTRGWVLLAVLCSLPGSHSSTPLNPEACPRLQLSRRACLRHVQRVDKEKQRGASSIWLLRATLSPENRDAQSASRLTSFWELYLLGNMINTKTQHDRGDFSHHCYSTMPLSSENKLKKSSQPSFTRLLHPASNPD